MGFSKQVKDEILSKQDINNDACVFPFLAGLFLSAAYVTEKSSKLKIGTDMKNLCDFLDTVFLKYYGEGISIQKNNSYKIKKTEFFEITLSDKLSLVLLKDLCIGEIINSKFVLNLQQAKTMILEEESLKSFICGVFVGCATSSISINSDHRQTTGYHLEFTNKSMEFLDFVKNILNDFQVDAKLISRRKAFVLYVKDAFEVSNVLALVGAFGGVFDLQNEMALRDLRNNVNRKTNCESANINKTVNASYKQNDAISLILLKCGLDELSLELQKVALLRLANPNESLKELVNLATFPITKSALAYRLNKLIEIAKTLE